MSMKQIWAPWRMDFIEANEKPPGCVFCLLPENSDDRHSLILHRGENVFVILNKYPYNNGHLMVVPNRHVSQLSQLPDDEAAELMRMTKIASKALEKGYHPEGLNLGMNLGAAAGAGIKDHLHMHLVPRWVGDTNFMPVLAETKAMPQHLMTSYDLLHGIFKNG